VVFSDTKLAKPHIKFNPLLVTFSLTIYKVMHMTLR
jgi:hypothetical protein